MGADSRAQPASTRIAGAVTRQASGSLPRSIRTASSWWQSAGGAAPDADNAPGALPENLLRDHTWKLLHFGDRRRVPLADERLGFRSVHAQQQIKRLLGRRQPVGFLVLSGALILEIKVKRAVGIEFEWHPATDRKAIQAVSNLESVC